MILSDILSQLFILLLLSSVTQMVQRETFQGMKQRLTVRRLYRFLVKLKLFLQLLK